MDIFESLENLNVSEECFEDIVGLVEMYLSEGEKVDNYYKSKQAETKQELDNAKSYQRKLNSTVDKKTNKALKKARNIASLANDAAHQDYTNASNHARNLDQEFGGEHNPDNYTDLETQNRADKALDSLNNIRNQFSEKGKQVHADIQAIKSKKSNLEKLAAAHQKHIEDSKLPAKISHGYGDGARRASGKKKRHMHVPNES